MQRDVLPPESPYAGPVRLSARLIVELTRTAASGSRREGNRAAGVAASDFDAATAPSRAHAAGVRNVMSSRTAAVQASTPSAVGAPPAETLSSAATDGAAPVARQVDGGAAAEMDAGDDVDHTRAAAASATLPAPDLQPPVPLASTLGGSAAARLEAEEACLREAASPGSLVDAVRRALAALRRAGSEGLSHAALADCLRDVPTSPPEAHTPVETAAPDEHEAAEERTGQLPSDPGLAYAGTGATRSADASTPHPEPAAMAAAAATLRLLLRHGLVWRVPGFHHVAYVASEHSQRFLLLPPFEPAPSVPRPTPPAAHASPTLGPAAATVTAPDAGPSADSAVASSEGGHDAASQQQPPQPPGGALLDGDAAGGAARQLPPVTSTAAEDGAAGAAASQPKHGAPRPSRSVAGLEAASVNNSAARELPPRQIPLQREQVIRPWLDHAGAVNALLWHALCGKAVTIVLRHPGARH